MRIKAVVFDLGGTLIRYTGSYAKWPDLETPGFMAAYNALRQDSLTLPKFLDFRDAGFAMLPDRWAQAAAGVRNLRLIDLLAEVLAKCGVEDVHPDLLLAASEAYQTAVKEQATVMPAAQETLSQLAAQGYKLGLISNTMFTGAAHVEDMDRFGLTRYFDTMLFSADVNQWKPTAKPFNTVLKTLDIAPDEAVFIGDDPSADVVGGMKAGMRTIHIKSGQRDIEPDGIQPHAQIVQLAELPPVLSGWQAAPH